VSPPRAGTTELTSAGRWLAGLSAGSLAAAWALSSPALALWGAAGALAVAAAWGWAALALAGVARGGITARLEPLSPTRPGEPLPMRTHQPVRVPLHLEVSRALRVGGLTIEPVTTPTLTATLAFRDPPGDHPPWTLSLEADRVGDAWLHGLRVRATGAAGLARVTAWVPSSLVVRVTPRRFPTRGARLRPSAARAALQDHASLAFSRRRGMGMEIRELRDHVPGDPFKHIAWRASARRGKLVSREFESDLALSAWVLLDVSPSMFWGPTGGTRVDFALELAHDLFDVVLRRRDRAGLIVFDEDVRLQIDPGTGRAHMLRLLDGLLEVPHLVHAGRTELGREELAERVAAWFETQEGIRFNLPLTPPWEDAPDMGTLDVHRMASLARERVDALLRRRGRTRPVLPVDAYAADPVESALRAFCRHAGIPLPMDPVARPGAQGRGLETATRAVLSARGGPHTVVVVSDFFSADDPELLRRAALAARRKRHHLIAFCPWDPAFEGAIPETGAPLERAVLEAQRLRVLHHLEAAQAVLRPAGATFLRCGPEDVLPKLLTRLRHVA